MMIGDKNDIFERVENFHADLAWNYPEGGIFSWGSLFKLDQFAM